MSTDFCGVSENKCKCSVSSKTITPLMKNISFPGDNLLRGHKNDAGCDIRIAEDRLVRHHSSNIVSTGLHIAIPEGFVGMIRGRSGLAFKKQVEVFNGTIDSGYRGEVKVILKNFGSIDREFTKGDRIAQLLLVPINTTNWTEVKELPNPDDGRNEGGFGSTGER